MASTGFMMRIPPRPSMLSARLRWTGAIREECRTGNERVSLRDVEDLFAERGIDVSFWTVAKWAAKFGLKFARQLLRRSRGRFIDKCQPDAEPVPARMNSHGRCDLRSRVSCGALPSSPRRGHKCPQPVVRSFSFDQGAFPATIQQRKRGPLSLLNGFRASHENTCREAIFAARVLFRKGSKR